MKPCAWVDNFISIETDGWTRPCCGESDEQARISHISKGLKNAFNDEKLIKLKNDLETTGFSKETYYACKRCEIVEQAGEQSLRTGTNFLSGKREIKAIQFKMSNKCQLTCAHCGPDRSSSWAKLLNIKPHVKVGFNLTENFLNELKELLPNLEFIKFTGGEPFLDPDHWKILEYLSNFPRKHCKLIYITNGLIKPNVELWKGWKDVECSISIDGFKETYEWFRRSASWEELIENIYYIKKFSAINIAYSITPWTAADYSKLINYFDFDINPFPVIKPIRCSLKNFPKQVANQYFPNTPFFNLTSDTGNMKIYKYFAIDWDLKWNTPGLSEKLYPWINYA